jgi:hypothetical protein
VVPRAAHRVADDQSVDEWAVIMSAVSANREQLVARAHQQHVLVAHAPEHHAARLEHSGGYSLGKIRSRTLVGI